MSEQPTPQPEVKEVRLSRVFHAPIERVFQAWTEADLVVQWMKCEADVNLTVEGWAPAPGARFTTTMSKPGAWETSGTGSFLEVDAPRLLVYKSDPDPAMGMPECTVRVELEEVAEGTRLTLTHRGLPSDEICGFVSTGWTGGFEMLASLLA